MIKKNLKIFLVGGAIRDKFLLYKMIELDWLIVNTSINILIKKGFIQVGKDFPVFLHPETKEEYALARKERKIKLGYCGFNFDSSKFIKINEDIFRRDFTINAIIMNHYGNIFDPFNGLLDIKKNRLNHISYSFKDDPIRIFRMCRFYVKYINFKVFISSYTLSFIKRMINNLEITNITHERLVKEIMISIKYENAIVFFLILYDSFILKFIFLDLYMFINFFKKFYFIKRLNLFHDILRLFYIINFYTNNPIIKLLILFYKILQKFIYFHNTHKTHILLIINHLSKKFSISKTNTIFIVMIINIIKLYNKINSINFKIIRFFLKKLIINKNKIRLINIILICILESKNTYVGNFHYKYLILDVVDYLIRKNNHINNNHFNDKILNYYIYRYLKKFN
jgi:tRNA nucleotidyltransferase (CCA-adding enzyme)